MWYNRNNLYIYMYHSQPQWTVASSFWCTSKIQSIHVTTYRAFDSHTSSYCDLYSATLIIRTPLSTGWLLPYRITWSAYIHILYIWYLAYIHVWYLYSKIMASSVQKSTQVGQVWPRRKVCRAHSSSLNLQPQPQKIIGHAFCACVVMYFLVSS